MNNIPIAKFEPQYGMSDELNSIYAKNLGIFACLNANTEEQQNNCLNTIRLILDSSTMTYIDKLITIELYIATNKDYKDSKINRFKKFED